MSCLARLALVFVLLPLLELVVLIRIGEVVGFLPTLALVVLTGVAGAALARAEGLRVVVQLNRELMAGRLPGQALMDGASVLVGGALLLTPGVLTDVAGLALLFPPTRRWIQRRVRARLEAGLASGAVRFVVMGPGGFGGGPGDAPSRDASSAGLDPRNEIRVEAPEE